MLPSWDRLKWLLVRPRGRGVCCVAAGPGTAVTPPLPRDGVTVRDGTVGVSVQSWGPVSPHGRVELSDVRRWVPLLLGRTLA